MTEYAWKPLPRQAVAMSCPAFEILYGGQKGGGKAMQCVTSIPTPSGWTTQGELRPGDQIFAPDGTLTTVLYNTGPMYGRPCYRLHFSDGTSIVADEDHRWATLTHRDRCRLLVCTEEWKAKRRASRPKRGTGKRPDLALRNAQERKESRPTVPQVRTTREIMETLKVSSNVTNHSIEAHAPVFGDYHHLPVPPYTLGAWLGDGTSSAGVITTPDHEVIGRIRQDGFTVTEHSDPLDFGIIGLLPRLKDIGVYRDKHIPPVYLRASVAQRIELLRGLMDTDGWADKDGSCHYCSTNRELLDGVVELLRSLGIIVRVSEKLATCTNSSTRAQSLAFYARFMPTFPVFHLKRKLERQKPTHPRWTRRFIERIEPVESVPVCCIKVDREDGLYIAGEQWITTHNTDLMVAFWLPLLAAAQRRFEQGRVEQRKCRIPLFRKNLKDLKDIINKSFSIYPAFDPGAQYNNNEKIWRFSSGATVEFHHLDGPDDHLGWNGQEIIAAGFDQAEEIPYNQYSFITANIRTADPYYKPFHRSFLTANPGGRHGDWVKKRFIDPHPDGNKVLVQEETVSSGEKVQVTRAFIPASLRDNPYLNSDGRYEAQLRATLPKHLVERYLEGNWDVVDGAFFASMIDERTHSMTWREFLERSPDGIPTSWDLGYGMDWGASNYAATEFAARDSDDRIWCFDELYTPGVTGRIYGEKLKQLISQQRWSKNHKWTVSDMYGMVDTEAWAKFGADGAAPADSLQMLGFRLFMANKDRRAGIEQIRERLVVRPDGLAGIIFIRDRVPNLWRNIRTISVSDKDPEDYDMRGEAHAVDAIRFKLMDWPILPADQRDKASRKMDEWWERYNKQRAAKAQEDKYAVNTGYE